MSSSATAGHGVADIYKSVIGDVIAQVKEAFLDENVDIDILNQLKKEWEEKVSQSGCVDMDQRSLPSSMRAVQQAAAGGSNGRAQSSGSSTAQLQHTSHIRIQPSTQQMLLNQLHIQQLQQIEQSQQQPVSIQLQIEGSGQQGVFPQLRPLTHNLHPGVQYPVMQGGNTISGIIPQGLNVLVMSNGQQIHLGNASILHGELDSSQQRDPVHQVDGNIDCSSEEQSPLVTSSSGGDKKKKRFGRRLRGDPKLRAEAEKISRDLLRRLQLDGNGMSDSSSEEEDDEEEDDDPLRRMANRIGEGSAEDGDNEDNEEEPLNSEDDQSDDEDLDTLFDADNVVMCQFEKVHRARSKWKFSLKDGIMHINGRDFCFSKCTGEAEW